MAKKRKVKRKARRGRAVALRADQLNPAHYHTETKLQAINVIEGFGLGFHDGNAVKYITRAGRKPGAEGSLDRRKAIWYLLRQEQIITGEVPAVTIDAPITV